MATSADASAVAKKTGKVTKLIGGKVHVYNNGKWDAYEHPRDAEGKFVKGSGAGLNIPTPPNMPSVPNAPKTGAGKQAPANWKFYKPGYKPKDWHQIKGANAKASGKQLWDRKKAGEFANDYEFWLAAQKLAADYKKKHPNGDAASANQVVNAAFRHELEETGGVNIGGAPGKPTPSAKQAAPTPEVPSKPKAYHKFEMKHHHLDQIDKDPEYHAAQDKGPQAEIKYLQAKLKELKAKQKVQNNQASAGYGGSSHGYAFGLDINLIGARIDNIKNGNAKEYNAPETPTAPHEHGATPGGVKIVSKFLAPGDLEPTGKKMPGVNGALVYKDSKGNEWLVKFPGGSKGTSQAYSNSLFLVDLDVATSRIQNKAGLAVPSINAKTVKAPNGEAKTASVHKMFSRAKDAFPDHNPQLSGPNELSDEDLMAVQKQMILDWLLSNHDPHSGNFLKTDKGIVGIDKGQSFKYFGKDKLTPNFGSDLNPPLAPNKPVYSTLMHQMMNGQGEMFSFNDPELQGTIQRIQNIPDDEYKDLLRGYATKAAKVGLLNYPGKKYGDKPDVEAFLQAAVDRKNNLNKDFSNLQAELDKAAGKFDAKYDEPANGPTVDEKADAKLPKKGDTVSVHYPHIGTTKTGVVQLIANEDGAKKFNIQATNGQTFAVFWGEGHWETPNGKEVTLTQKRAEKPKGPTANKHVGGVLSDIGSFSEGDVIDLPWEEDDTFTFEYLSEDATIAYGTTSSGMKYQISQEDLDDSIANGEVPTFQSLAKPSTPTSLEELSPQGMGVETKPTPKVGQVIKQMNELSVGDKLLYQGPIGDPKYVEVTNISPEGVIYKNVSTGGIGMFKQQSLDKGNVKWAQAPKTSGGLNLSNLSANPSSGNNSLLAAGDLNLSFNTAFKKYADGDWTKAHLIEYTKESPEVSLDDIVNHSTVKHSTTLKTELVDAYNGAVGLPTSSTAPPGYKVVPHPDNSEAYAIQKPNGEYSKNKDGTQIKSWPTPLDANNSSTMKKYKDQAEAQAKAGMAGAQAFAINAPLNDPETQLKGGDALEYSQLKAKIAAGEGHTPEEYLKLKNYVQKIKDSAKAGGAAQVENWDDDEASFEPPTPSQTVVKKGKLPTPKWKKKGGAPAPLEKATGPNALEDGKKLYEMKKAGKFNSDDELWKEASKLSNQYKKKAQLANPGKKLQSGIDYSSPNQIRNVAQRLEFDEIGDVIWETKEEKTAHTETQSAASKKKANVLHEHKPVVKASTSHHPPPHGSPGFIDPTAPVGSYANPHSFKDGATQALQAYGYKYTDHSQPWPSDQKSAWYNFSGSGYSEVNTYFRVGEAGFTFGNVEVTKKRCKAIVDAFKSPNIKPLEDWTIVTRGTNGGWELGIGSGTVTFDELKAQEGKVVRNKEPKSSSLRTRPAFGGQIRITYKLPPGFRGLGIYGKSAHPSENEMILPPGMAYRILEVKKGDSSFSTEVLVEVVDVKLPEIT